MSILREITMNKIDLSNKLDKDGHSALSLSIKEEKYLATKLLIQS